MMNISLYLLRGLVYAQPFLWLYLYDREIKLNKLIKVIFPISLGIVYFILYVTGFSFSQYTNSLLRFYVVLLLYSVSVIFSVGHYGYSDSMYLGFLFVFVNSYYWEFMMHFNAILYYGISKNQIIQAFHLIVAYMMYKRLIIINRKRMFKFLIVGLMVSNLNFLAYNFINRFWVYGFAVNQPLFNNITRFACLNILLYAILNHGVIIKKEDV